MAELTVQNVALVGTLTTYAAAAGGGDNFRNDGVKTFIHIKNGSGGAITVTFDDVRSATPEGANSFDPDVDVSLGAGEDWMIGPFPIDRFGPDVGITYSGVTSLTVAAVRV